MRRSTRGWYTRNSSFLVTACRSAFSRSWRLATHARHVRVEELATAAAVLLRLVQRDVRIPQQRAGVDIALVRESDAHARRHERFEAIEVEGLVQRADDALGDLLGLGDVLEVFAEHDELVAAEPSDGVSHPHHGADALSRLTQEHVACLVPEAVVHHLEVVEIEEQHREDAASPRDQVDRVLGAIQQQHAVRKVGERVVRRLVRELGLGTRGLLACSVRRVQQHRETGDHDDRHHRRGEDHHDFVHVVPERRTGRREHRREQQRGGEQQEPHRMDPGQGEMLGRTRDGLSRGMRGCEREHPEAHDVPGVDPLREGVAVEQAAGVLCEVGREHEREAGAEEPHGRAPSTGHEQQPEQRGNEDDVEQWVGREHRALEELAVVDEARVDDQELPDREPCRDRDCGAVDEAVPPPLRSADDDEQPDRASDERVGEQVQPVRGRHRRTAAAEERVDLPDRGAEDQNGHREREQGPGLATPPRGHRRSQAEGADRAGAGRHRRDGRCLGARADDDNCGEGQGRQREPPWTRPRKSYHENSSAPRSARSSLPSVTERS